MKNDNMAFRNSQWSLVNGETVIQSGGLCGRSVSEGSHYMKEIDNPVLPLTNYQ